MPTRPQTYFSRFLSFLRIKNPSRIHFNLLEVLNMARHICDQLLYFDNRRYKDRSFTTRDESTSSARPKFQINFHLSCKAQISKWVFNEDSSELQLLRTFNGPKIKKLIRLNLGQFLKMGKARKIMRKRIKKWPVWPDGRRLLINFALKKAREVMASMPASHNVVHLYLHAIPRHRHIFNEDVEIRSAIQESMEEAKDCMVPAAESSIESLKNTISMESGSCAICLEEFGSGCESVSMPCSHIFHGNCIKKWLNTSHYCPICRFQMPTS